MIKRYCKDIIVISILILTCLLLFTILFLANNSGDIVNVRVNGCILYSYPLNTDSEHIIESSDGCTNTLVIKNNEAYLTEASCPDKLCVKTGKIKNNGQSIVCLPNKVVIEIESSSLESDYDIMSGYGSNNE